MLTARRPHHSPASFNDLGVPARLTAVLAARNITEPFPIQTATIPDALSGRDVLGKGRTGSGKTYAFVLPILARLSATPTACRPGRPRALILVPTRELATQIDAAMAPLAAAVAVRTMTVFGGVSQTRQIAALRAGVDIVVACPGRLADLIGDGHIGLGGTEITVLDEADHMADLGFLPVVRRLLDQTPTAGQRLLFSATLDSGVDVLVRRYLRDPVAHNADQGAVVDAPSVHHVLYLEEHDRFPVLVDLTAAPGRAIVFTRTKRRARVLTRQLVAAGVAAVELHGNLGQPARDRNLRAFAAGAATTLVATDIAARGIHVDDVRIVIHADPPGEAKAYLHRSGRTGRAGATGTIVTLSTDAQRVEVHALTARAGVKPRATRIAPGHPLLAELAPGQRTLVRRDYAIVAPSRRASSSGASGAAAGHSTTGRPAPGGRTSAISAGRSATGQSAVALSARAPRRRARG